MKESAGGLVQPTAAPVARISSATLSRDELIEQLRGFLSDSDRLGGAIELTDIDQQPGFLAGFDLRLRVLIPTDVGDYALPMCQAGEIRVTGSAGVGFGEGIAGGAIRLHGSAGDGCAVAAKGGTLAVYGDAGHRCAVAMQGGEVFVRGDVGHQAASRALRGTLVIGGDAGHQLGAGMLDVAIYLRGHAASLAPGLEEQPLSKADRLKLGLVLINAGIKGETTDFRRIRRVSH
jgi:methylamine---glutamate N-methyltransferase subunit B